MELEQHIHSVHFDRNFRKFKNFEKKNGKGQDIKYSEGPLAEGATARNPHIFQKEHRNATAVLENNDSQ